MDTICSQCQGHVHHIVVSLVLICASEAKRCGYRLYEQDPWSRDENNIYYPHIPTEVGVKDCPWGCCWDQKDNVCCPFPMKVVILGFVAALSVIIIICAIVCFIWYRAASRRRLSYSRSQSGGQVVTATTLTPPTVHVFTYPSAAAQDHTPYTHIDPEAPPPYS